METIKLRILCNDCEIQMCLCTNMIFCSQVRRVNNLISPGVLLTYQTSKTGSRMVVRTKICKYDNVTDTDWDGVNNEIMIVGGYCFSQKEDPDFDPDYPCIRTI